MSWRRTCLREPGPPRGGSGSMSHMAVPLGGKPVAATWSLCKAKGERVVPLERVAFRKAENCFSNIACGNLGNQKEMQ